MKFIILSVQPKWLEKILNGEKTIEIRKSNPKCELPIDVYLYCCKSTYRFYINGIGHNLDLLYKNPNGKIIYGDDFELQANSNFDKATYYNGKVVGKFTLNKVDYCDLQAFSFAIYEQSIIEEKSCLTELELVKYSNGKPFYAWHIDNLVIFDKPKELSEFNRWVNKTIYSGMDCPPYQDEVLTNITKAPQNYCYCEVE